MIKLREVHKLDIVKFLILQRSCLELVPKLEDAFDKYEMSAMPCSLCALDSSLSIPADKASPMHITEEPKAHPDQSKTKSNILLTNCLSRILIVDSMVVL